MWVRRVGLGDVGGVCGAAGGRRLKVMDLILDLFACLLLFCIIATSKDISGWVLICVLFV